MFKVTKSISHSERAQNGVVPSQMLLGLPFGIDKNTKMLPFVIPEMDDVTAIITFLAAKEMAKAVLGMMAMSDGSSASINLANSCLILV